MGFSTEICSPHMETMEFSVMDNEGEMELKPEKYMGLPLLSKDGEHLGRYMITLTAVSALGGFLFGYDTGVVSGAMLKIKEDMELKPWQEETVVSSTIVGAIIGSLIGGPLNDLFGRKPMMVAASIIFTVSAVLLGVSGSFTMLSLGRVVIGIGIGLASVTTPVYIAESAPSSVRGRLVIVNILLTTLGQFAAGVIDGSFAHVSQGWRWMLGLSGVPSLLMLIGVLPLPESPRWLLGRGRVEESTAVLQKLRGKIDVSDEVQSISASIATNHHQEPASLGEMLSVPPLRRALTIGCGVQLLQQVIGINTIMYYAAEIYSKAGFPDTAAIWLSALSPLFQSSGCLISMYFVEQCGRRTLLIFSCVGVFFCLLVVGLSFYLSEMTSESVVGGDKDCQYIHNVFLGRLSVESCFRCVQTKGCGFCLADDLKTGNCYVAAAAVGSSVTQEATDISGRCSPHDWIPQICPERFAVLGVIGTLSYLLCFGCGLSTLPWVLNAEIYPLYARSLGNSLSVTVNWLANFVVSVTFLTMSSPSTGFTIYGTFWFYASLAFFGCLWLYAAVPETGGLSMEKIQTLFEGKDGIFTLRTRNSNSVRSSASFESLSSGPAESSEFELPTDINEYHHM